MVTHSCDVFDYRVLERVFNPEPLFQLLSVALSEYFVFLVTLATFKVTHIFYDSYGRDFKLIEHLNPFNDIYICEFLRCGHYDSRFDIDFLAECQLNVAGARGEIHNEVV